MPATLAPDAVLDIDETVAQTFSYGSRGRTSRLRTADGRPLMTEHFTITRDIAAPRAVVFDALTLPEHFSVWFGTADVEVPRDALTMDVRPGGEFRAVMILPDGHRIDWAGEYVAVDPPAHLAMTLTDDPGAYAGLPVLFDLDEHGDTTRLTISQERADFSDEQVAATVAGYNAFIDDIERVVAGASRD